MLNYENLLVLESLVGNDIFLTLRCVEIDRKLDTLRLINPQRQVRFLLQIFQTETFEVFLGERLGVEQAGSGCLAGLAPGRPGIHRLV